MNIKNIVNAIQVAERNQRGNYHLTFGELIDKLKQADDSLSLEPKIKGISAYRGYYSDIALLTNDNGLCGIYENDPWGGDNGYDFNGNSCIENKEDFSKKTPKELAELFESLLGKHKDGYKGGGGEISRDDVLWIAQDMSNCSDKSIVAVDDKLNFFIKNHE